MFERKGRGLAIADIKSRSQDRSPEPEILFLFPEGKGPDAREIAGAIEAVEGASISLDSLPAQAGFESWFEVQRNGLTYELAGPETGAASYNLQPDRLIGLDATDAHAPMHTIELALGPHIASGRASLPIVQEYLNLGRHIAEGLDGLSAVFWRPSRVAMDVSSFHTTIGQWVDGGQLPLTIFITFRDVLGEGLQSRGLSHFTGQELRMEAGLMPEPEQSEQLGQRLAAQLIHQGTISEPQEIAGPDGRPLRLEPSRNGRFVRVWMG
ncbi:hypothetical protein [Parerythrobacter jejuensis]|uniref:DUF4261 domain-containing protein n=1 Tax=Parerythrobacter jejuensis TaxID=795812 RepID=A0A845ARX5_9SPHN|nr:hypothetical protein [Parerythrobacter jejuensis]MXP32239.1 hypothetical protein [Parerythrobacter jejuensis]